MKQDIVRRGYNQTAHLYAQDRASLQSERYVRKFLQELTQPSMILDLGCGNGLPTDATLLQKGHAVIGLDISETQIQLARKNCPRGEYLVRDIGTMKPQEFSVDGVIMLYALFHLPREQHAQILKVINTFIPLGAPFLVTMGDQDFEGFHDFHGVQMWSSHYGPQKNTQLFQQAGFEVLRDEIDHSGQERHQVLLGKKVRSIPVR